MIRLLSYLIMAIAILFALEHWGVVEKREFLPQLPRPTFENFRTTMAEDQLSLPEEAHRETLSRSVTFTERVAARQDTDARPEKSIASTRLIGALPLSRD
jgi:hypothetical protein